MKSAIENVVVGVLLSLLGFGVAAYLFAGNPAAFLPHTQDYFWRLDWEQEILDGTYVPRDKDKRTDEYIRNRTDRINTGNDCLYLVGPIQWRTATMNYAYGPLFCMPRRQNADRL